MAVMILLAVTSIYTVLQRIRHVHGVATGREGGATPRSQAREPVDRRGVV
jgi:hypothetical protein